MPRKEKTNAKTWERERRNRMNSYFKTLGDLLPPNQEGKNRNKVDILIHASKYIKDLTNRTEELFHAHAVDAHKEELNRLKKLVAQLYSRTQLLSALLKDAGITVPAEPALEKISPLKWSNKINVEDAEKYIDRLKEWPKSEKRKGNVIGTKTPSKRKTNGSFNTPPKKLSNDKETVNNNNINNNNSNNNNNNSPVEDQENHVNSSLEERAEGKGDDGVPNKNGEVRNNAEEVSTQESETSEVAGPKSSSGIRKLESKKKVKRKTKDKDKEKEKEDVVEQKSLNTVTSNANNVPITIQNNQNQSITNLVPGTLILSGGKIMPLITTPLTQNILVNGAAQSPNSIILGNNQANPMIVMQPLANNRIRNPIVPVRSPNIVKAVQKVTLNTVPSIEANVGIHSHDWVSNVKTIIEATKIGGRKGILPKGKEITKTTMAYKVPIPVVHRDNKLKKNADNCTEKMEKKSSRAKKSKRKKSQDKVAKDEINEKITVNLPDNFVDDSSKKRRNKSDCKSDSPPTKLSRTLPETCESIENLRHVVEKIGEEPESIIKNTENLNSTSENTSSAAPTLEKNIPTVDDKKTPATTESTKNSDESSEDNVLRDKQAENKLESSIDEVSEASQEQSATKLTKESSTSSATKLPEELSVDKESHLPGLLDQVTEVVMIDKEKEVCDLNTRFDNLLQATEEMPDDSTTIGENTKIILNLDTNTTTTMKPEINNSSAGSNIDGSSSVSSSTVAQQQHLISNKIPDKLKCADNISKSLSYNTENTFIPISNRAEGLHSDLSNDLFASLQVPSNSHNPESISPTAAFLMAFPLVSSLNGKTEVLEEEMKEDLKYHSQTPPMLLQIGTIEPNSFKVKSSNSNEDKSVNSSSEKSQIKSSNCQTQSPDKSHSTQDPGQNHSNQDSGLAHNQSELVHEQNQASRQNQNRGDQSLGQNRQDQSSGQNHQSRNQDPALGQNHQGRSQNQSLGQNYRNPDQNLGQNHQATDQDRSLGQNHRNQDQNLGQNQAHQEVKISETTPAPPKALPKIINNETFKDRLYKVVPYSDPQISGIVNNSYSNSSTSTGSGNNDASNINNSSDNAARKIPQINNNTSINNTNNNAISNTTNNINSLASIPTSCSQETVAKKSPEKSDSALEKYGTISSISSVGSSGTITSNTNPTSLASTSTNVINSTVNNNGNKVEKMNQNLRYPTLPDYLPTYPNYPSSSTETSMLPIDNSRIYQQPTSQEYQSRNLGGLISSSAQSIQYQFSSQDSSQRTYVESQSTQNNYVIPSKENNTLLSYQEYNQNNKNVNTSPTTTQLNRTTYSGSRNGDNLNEKISNTENSYQGFLSMVQSNKEQDNQQQQVAEVQQQAISQNYPVKQTPTMSSFISGSGSSASSTDQRVKMADNTIRSKVANPDNQAVVTSINSSVNKINPGHFSNTNNTFSYDTKSLKANSLISDGVFPDKRNDLQNYTPYTTRGNDHKKMFDSVPNVEISKSSNHNQNCSLTRYPPHQLQQQPQQQQESQQQTFAVTSNYGQSTLTDNLGKSTTTVAHNSSNFSILSWTTFSPIGGGSSNNNLVQFETGTDHVDDTEGKTICENFSYTPLHKENIGFGNIISNESFPADGNHPNPVDKAKPKMANQKAFDDASKTAKVQPMQSASEKTNRSHNLANSGNQSITEEFKYNAGNNQHKNKSKFLMDSSFTQTEFAGGLEHIGRHQQHSATKSHQIVSSKSDKGSYTETQTYDTQVQFDIADTVSQSKCPEIYPGPNYKAYAAEKDQQIKYQPIVQAQSLQHDNNSFSKQQHQQHLNLKKPNIHQQQQQAAVRPPVNWMMTPEIKHNTNIPDLILPPIGKELEFCQNNIFSQAPSYNQSNQFYNNYEVSVAGTSFPNVSTIQADSRRIPDGFYPDDQPFSWSPSKNGQSTDQQVVPSTLPTLVGDLALGTNPPDKQSSFLYGQMPPRSSNELAKTSGKDKDRDYHVMINNQNVQSAQGTSFLSVSQLVEHEKAEKSHQQANHHTHHAHHHQQPASQGQTRKHQRKASTNTSPRSTGKRQMEMRKQTSEQQLQQHTDDAQKASSTHAYADHGYQQPQQASKYQQNDILWRNRNCKNNYTAEALIGVHDGNNSDKQLHTPAIKFSADYSQNKFSGGLTTDMVMPPINYLGNPEDGNGYGQVMNQNFNHSSYAYSPNANIYPTTNFMAGISNTPSSYMMPLHENPTDYLETNSFLLPNVSNVTAASKSSTNSMSSVSISSSSSTTRTTSSTVAGNNVKAHPQYGVNKHSNCDKRNSYSNVSKKNKKKSESAMHNLDFPIASSMEDYHSHAAAAAAHHHHHHHHHHPHTSTFLPPPPPPPPPHANPLYPPQNHPHSAVPPNSNRRGGSSGNSAVMAHHPSGTSLTNFNLSTIFPEINDKVTGYKPPNVIAPGLSQSSNHSSLSYPQRVNYTTNNSLGSHVPQVSETGQFTSDLPAPPPSVLHYKAT